MQSRNDMRELDVEEAERLAGRRLDRRRTYATTADGKPDAECGGALVFEVARWSQACSGCHDGPNVLASTGSGCNECGFTGRALNAQWLPIQDKTFAAL